MFFKFFIQYIVFFIICRKLANWHELKDFTVVQGLLDGDVEEPGHFTVKFFDY